MTPEELIAVRKNAGLTQSELAKQLGLTVRGYQKLEAGESPIKELYAKTVQMVATTGVRSKPSGSAGGYALAGFVIARASLYASLEAGLITGSQAVKSLEMFLDDFPDIPEGRDARELTQAVLNSIAYQYGE